MAVRKILVPLLGADTEGAVLGTAMTVAQTFGAHLVGLFIRSDPTEALPYLGDGVSGQVIEQLMHAAKDGADKASAQAREIFTDTAARAGLPLVEKGASLTLPSARFLDVAGHRDDVVATYSRLSDIVIFGEGNATAAGGSTLEAAMMNAGRPVLIAPKAGVIHLGGTVVIGWDESPMAAHAVTAAIPFLKIARNVTILCVGEQNQTPEPGSLLVDYLALHEISTSVHVVEQASGRSVGSLLLDEAEKLEAGLLVVGGYSHSRIREFIIGGTTQHLRSNATIPVLMAH